MADHIDTAFAEDIYEHSGQRASVHGANDNVTAVAALLRAAEILKDTKPKNDIWLVHLTGEEYPADDLGARFFISKLFEMKQDISGVVLMDMIGYRTKKDLIFQVNAGDSEQSVRMAQIAMDASQNLAIPYTPVYRSRNDLESYLYNTDGVVFSDNGYSVIVLNQHLNADFMHDPHYHQTSDVSENVDFDFAVSVTRVAIETVARIAGR